MVSDVKIAGAFVMGGNVGNQEIISTRIGLKPGQTAILGELGLRDVPAGLPKEIRPPEAGDTLFVILKATAPHAAANP